MVLRFHGVMEQLRSLKELYNHFVDSVVSSVADGCPVEQRVLYDCTRANPEGVRAEDDIVFRNMLMVSRDRPHRFRSVQKGFWNNADSDVQSLLDELVTGPKSLCRLMESSRKFSLLFEENQKKDKANHVYSGPAFARVLTSFQFAEQRFNSRTKPLFRIFRLLPTVIQTLSDVTKSNDTQDAAWAEGLLHKFSGPAGYETLVSAAVVADALIACQPALRLEDSAAADFSLSGVEAARLKQTLWALLHNGGIFLEECDQTCTHACLRAIRNKTVFLRSGTPNMTALVLHWPAPGPGRSAPLHKAKQRLVNHSTASFGLRVVTFWLTYYQNRKVIQAVQDLRSVLRRKLPHV